MARNDRCMSDVRFSDFDLSANVKKALDAMGYEQPTPVQRSTIPMVDTGRDLMVQAQTGTGKTAAFGIPLVEQLGSKPQGIRVLVLAPTRELAKQVADELSQIGKFNRVRTAAVYGGASIDRQVAEIKFAHVVAGTPGRVLDHLRRGTLNLGQLTVLVLDEADEMLSMGFARELDQIMRYVPEKRQTLLFSATIPEDIKRYAKRYMVEPEFISMVDENVGADDVEHHYYIVSGVGRPRDLVQVIEYEDPESAIIFTNTRADSELVARYLRRQGHEAEYLNSDLPQKERERIMRATKDKNLRFLVATDIAARGIDITQLSHVINYTLPESPEVYIHRTGRTGRAGHKGTAISLIGPREIGVYYFLKRIYNVDLLERSVPSQAEIELRRDERKVGELLETVGARLGDVRADPEVRRLSPRLLEQEDAIDLVARILTFVRDAPLRAAVDTGPSFTEPTESGVLGSVPKPKTVRPGSRPETLSAVAKRVAILQSEFRGLPGEREDATPVRAPAVKEPPAVADPPPVIEDIVEEPPPAQPAKVDEAPREDDAAHSPVEARPESDLEPATDASVSEHVPVEVETATASARLRSPLPELPEGCVRLYINLGKRDKLGPVALRDQLAELAGLEPEDFVEVVQRSRHSYVTMDEEYADDLIDAVNGEKVGPRTIRVEVANDAT